MQKNGVRKIKNDIIFIAALLLVVTVAGVCFFLFTSEGDTVTVTVDGKLFGEYSLSEDRRVEIRTGEAFNVLVIENGQAYVSDASCPDGICVAHRRIYREGDSIICLPNKVVVSVRSSSAADVPDIVS